METRTLTCDACGHDLRYTGYASEGYLALVPQYKSHGSDTAAVFSMGIPADIKAAHHFCGIGCLAAWLGTKYPDAMNRYDRMMKKRQFLRDREAADARQRAAPIDG